MSEDTSSNNTQAEELDVDALLAGLQSPREERPMEGGSIPEDKPVANPSEAAAVEPPKQDSPWWAQEFDWNGKKIKPEREDQVKTWISQGYNYSQRMNEMNKQRAAWDQEKIDLLQYREKYNQYKDVDDYFSKNPDHWQKIQEAYKNRELGANTPDLSKVLAPIEAKLSQYDQLMQEIQEQKRQEAIAKADEALTSEIESTRKQYPTIDLSAKDEAGETLETRIIKHAMEIGTGSFRVAFRDYLHDQLVNTAKASGLEAAQKEKAIQAKKGIIGTSNTPTKDVMKEAPKGASWGDSSLKGANILKELGLF